MTLAVNERIGDLALTEDSEWLANETRVYGTNTTRRVLRDRKALIHSPSLRLEPIHECANVVLPEVWMSHGKMTDRSVRDRA